MTNDDNHLTGKCCSGYPNCYHALKNSVTPKMTNDDKYLPRNSKGEIILGNVFDGLVWAKEFMRIKQEKDFVIDESLMLGWFANAIMAGYDYAYREMRDRATPQQPSEPLKELDKEAVRFWFHKYVRSMESEKAEGLVITDILDDLCKEFGQPSALKELDEKEGSSIYITESTEGEWSGDRTTGKQGKVLWLNFKGNGGNHAMINLNNLASKEGAVISKAMYQAIAKFGQPSEKKALDEKEVLDLFETRWTYIQNEASCSSHVEYIRQEVRKFLKGLCSKFGQPSEKKALSEKDIANVSTLFCGRVRKWCAKNNIEYFGDYLIAPVFENVLKEIALPNEKKALSVEDMQIIYDTSRDLFEWIANAQEHRTRIKTIEKRDPNFDAYAPRQDKIDESERQWKKFGSVIAKIEKLNAALPARKEVKWPEKKPLIFKIDDLVENQNIGWNQAIDSCKKAYEEAMPAQREIKYPSIENFDFINPNDKEIAEQVIELTKKLNGG